MTKHQKALKEFFEDMVEDAKRYAENQPCSLEESISDLAFDRDFRASDKELLSLMAIEGKEFEEAFEIANR